MRVKGLFCCRRNKHKTSDNGNGATAESASGRVFEGMMRDAYISELSSFFRLCRITTRNKGCKAMRKIHSNILVHDRGRKDFRNKRLKKIMWWRLCCRYNRERHWELRRGECKQNGREDTDDQGNEVQQLCVMYRNQF